MSVAVEVQKNLDNIFKGDLSLKKFFASKSQTGDRGIDEWDSTSTDMVKVVSQTQVTLVPRIKSKTERNWLRGEIKQFCESHRSEIISSLNQFLPEGQVYFWEFKEDKITGTGLLSYIIQAKKKEQDQRALIRIAFQAKGLSNGSGGKREDPHELMTACLILLKRKVDAKSISSKPDGERQKVYKEIVDELAKASSRVVGSSGVSGFYIDPSTKKEPDLINLAKAISVSNYVIDQIGNARVDAVWQTGKTWASEISKFNVGPKTIKNYNSSDIIVKFTTSGKNGATHYWGLSLKKKGIGESEPTLLNKPLMGKTGFLEKRFKKESQHKTKIEAAKKTFFVGAVERKVGEKSYNGKVIAKMPIQELLKTADKLFTERQDKSDMLTGNRKYKGNKNIYFEALHNAFMEFDNDKEFFEEFLDTIFKINLQAYLGDVSFHFSLITGEGDYTKSAIVDPREPTEKEGRTTEEVFRELFSDPDNTTFRLIPGRDNKGDKKMAFEEGATAAKLYYEMAIGKRGKEHSIVMLEVRYKGALTSEPQFQVFMSTKTDGFSALYKKLASSKKIKSRW